jgi:hypothetical protein
MKLKLARVWEGRGRRGDENSSMGDDDLVPSECLDGSCGREADVDFGGWEGEF